MANATLRKEFDPSANPLRKKPTVPRSAKIIFLSLEGTVTEEEYFRDIVQKYFSSVKSKIKFISVQSEILDKDSSLRSDEEKSSLGKTQPYQLVEKITKYKESHSSTFEWDIYKDDEFWAVMDVDDHKSVNKIDKWKETIRKCNENGYSYAVSNPFFEVWLLLHHDMINEEDKRYAVNDEHEYEKTEHFKHRLFSLGVPLKDNKHIVDGHYNKGKIIKAVERAREIHVDKDDLEPKYLSTTVYRLLEKVIELETSGK